MEQNPKTISVYLETGNKKTFAGAVDWPGWCRSSKDEKSALQTLFDYRIRYAQAIQTSGVGFSAPTGLSGLTAVERLRGNAATDFGVPMIAPSADSSPLDDSELHRLQKILDSCWDTFDLVVKNAAGRQLRLGPRGGGRDLEKITHHVLDSASGYLASISWKQKPVLSADWMEISALTRRAVGDALAGIAGKTVEPRQKRGVVWTKRYFIRRLAWHLLDHAWEVEDRII